MFPVSRNATTLPPAVSPINRLDALMDRVFGDDGVMLAQAWSGMPVSMWEEEDQVTIECELPGVTDQDVDITIHKGVLFIRGERKSEEGRRYLFNNRPFGRFERALALPEAVRTDDVEASLKDGLLTIVLRKSPDAKPKKITLRSG